MKIHMRDFTTLTEGETAEWELIKIEEQKTAEGKPSMFKRNLSREYPKAVRHFKTIFPNNFLDFDDLITNKESLRQLNEDYLSFIGTASINERDILNFIKEKKAYHIIASILKGNYPFGHHNTFIIPEFMLGTSFKVDYLVIGKGSGGYQFVFVELEKPYDGITVKSGELGMTFRKGISQVEDWKIWLEAYYGSLIETFGKYKNPKLQLPDEFSRYDSSRMHFVVVAGRRDQFDERTYRIQREHSKHLDLKIFHYDNLYDFANRLIGQLTF